MKVLREFDIAHIGLRLGIHSFEYQIGAAFLECFENAPIQNCNVTCYVELTKRHDMLQFDFAFNGTIHAECDRCLEPIEVPLAANYHFYIKFDDILANDSSDNELDMIYLPKSESVINISNYIYEYLVLSLPMKAACPFNEGPNTLCNLNVIEKLQSHLVDNEQTSDPRWDALKNLKKDNKKKQ